MGFKIVVDSCTDLTPQQKNDLRIINVPLTIFAGGSSFVDDDTLDQKDLLFAMKQSEDAPSTACPSPQAYMDAFDCGEDDIYVITLSALLSGSHNCAEQARIMLEEEKPELNIHVFNSCSAASGQTNILFKLLELAESGLPFKRVVREVEQYIYEMTTYFVLESLENLRKNGRLSKLQAVITGALRIKLFMGATPEGEICKLGQALSMKQALNKLVDKMASDEGHKGRRLVISQCNCPARADAMKKLVSERCSFSEIIIVETRGIATVYAYDGGVVFAY